MRVYIIDLAGWSLVGLAALAGLYACYLFDAKVCDGLSSTIISVFR